MSIIIFLILGAIVGWVAARVLGREEGVLMSIVIGIVGAFIGSFVSRLFTGTDQSYLSLNLGNLLWAFIGSLVFVAVLNAFTRRSHHNIS